MDTTATSNRKNKWRFYSIQAILSISWIGYLIKFYTFYEEAYFFLDKRLSLFLQLLSFLHDNWMESFIYFIVSFILMSITLFFTYLVYLVDKKDQRYKGIVQLFLVINLISCLSLIFNVAGIVFFILFVLAASLVYIISILAAIGYRKEEIDYEEGEVIEIKGPFETEEQAIKVAVDFITQWQEKEKLILGEEIYREDSEYYASIYIETIKK
ncbi:hypothetical protein UAW_01845 [Enterococcus haemoperoxidus ATCC BAA-382]|uniref:Uncharacterized protein n=2 Tax=Enterococcus haemoperoxidus TaxID=155618 RepID=R2SNC6_9ENTE|nr:hypothetical protein UAW_01845 [Enterococcus haemoperoxidus ATCC BAA-382]EOT60176.1 hypothetical protein I583_02811 [Enterococcus haemoperoxidus ATCC BAA-382]